MAPLIAQLIASGLGVLGNALLAKGKDAVEEKLGVKIPSLDSEVPLERLVELRRIEFEHEEALKAMQIRQAEIDLEAEKAAQGAVTERWKADMLSDSWLSKNIRPMVLIYLLGAYTVFSISSGFEFNVTQAYVELLAQMLMLVMGAYFAGRTLEKIIDMKERGKQ